MKLRWNSLKSVIFWIVWSIGFSIYDFLTIPNSSIPALSIFFAVAMSIVTCFWFCILAIFYIIPWFIKRSES
jgi:hypothetical protein